MIHGATIIAVLIWLASCVSAAYDAATLPDDPTRYCYAVVADQPWSCYLKADRPQGHTPVWVGPESMVQTASVATER